MEIRVWIVARRGEEPRLHGPSVSHAFDAACSLSQPHVAKATAKQAALAALLGQLAERAEPAIDRRGVDADAVVCATHLEAPGAQCWNSQCAHLCTPGREEGRVWCAEPHLDPPAGATAGGDRGICVGHELGNDLHQVDAALGEVLAEVASAHRANPHRLRRQQLSHNLRGSLSTADGPKVRRRRTSRALHGCRL